MRDLDALFAELRKSTFRARFKLSRAERVYLAQRSWATILEHARRFVRQRLAAGRPANDGRQTPMRGHPVFVAQHATATCCRKCLAKWHGIRQDRPLSEQETEYIVRVIERWLATQAETMAPPRNRQKMLFPTLDSQNPADSTRSTSAVATNKSRTPEPDN